MFVQDQDFVLPNNKRFHDRHPYYLQFRFQRVHEKAVADELACSSSQPELAVCHAVIVDLYYQVRGVVFVMQLIVHQLEYFYCNLSIFPCKSCVFH